MSVKGKSMESGQYLLFVDYVTPEKTHVRRWWNRSSRNWSEHKSCGLGYRSHSVAAGQVTRLEKKGFELPNGCTLQRWGYEHSSC